MYIRLSIFFPLPNRHPQQNKDYSFLSSHRPFLCMFAYFVCFEPFRTNTASSVLSSDLRINDRPGSIVKDYPLGTIISPMYFVCLFCLFRACVSPNWFVFAGYSLDMTNVPLRVCVCACTLFRKDLNISHCLSTTTPLNTGETVICRCYFSSSIPLCLV